MLQRLIAVSEQAHNLSVNNPCQLNSSLLESEMSRGMNSKKQHEVSLLIAEIVELCIQNDLQHIVDIGSGLVTNLYLQVLLVSCKIACFSFIVICSVVNVYFTFWN